jgi:hypothetical protein
MSTDLPRPFSPAELAELIAMPELAEAEWKEVLRQAGVAAGESAIKLPSPLDVLKDVYDHSCYSCD